MLLLVFCGDSELNLGPVFSKPDDDNYLQPSTSTGVRAVNGNNRDERYLRPTFQCQGDDSLTFTDDKDNSRFINDLSLCDS